jgi:high affinity Mn2+ porin
MRAIPSCKPLAAFLALGYCGAALAAAPAAPAELARLIEQLSQRVERLERHNAQLESALRERTAQAPDAAVIDRVQALEAGQQRFEQALQSDTISEREPELTARLKALESQAVGAQSAARKVEALQGIAAGLSLTTVAQKPYGAAGANSALGYRGDAYVALPLAPIGGVEQKVFAQFRLGQGGALNLPASFSNPNAGAFQLGGGLRPDDAVLNLGQAWYQAVIPLPYGGYKPRSKERLEINFGKMDPFVFFDQNAAAGDETRQFLNSAFVHNPLLDAGHDIGFDANGFAPGLRLSYYNASAKPSTWRLSLGVFGAGANGANYQRGLSAPLVMAQAETEQRLFGGLAGAYRVYAWRNAQASHFDAAVAAPEPHSGWGLSADQRVGDGVTLFGRYGHQVRGNVAFDRALTLGAEFSGSYWDRGGDSVGVAAGWLATSAAYRAFTAAAGDPASAAERVAELYYRYRVSKQFELSPHLQYIGDAGGNGVNGALRIVGLRAQITY